MDINGCFNKFIIAINHINNNQMPIQIKKKERINKNKQIMQKKNQTKSCRKTKQDRAQKKNQTKSCKKQIKSCKKSPKQNRGKKKKRI